QARSKVLVLFLRIYGSENKFNFNRWTKYIFLERVIYIVLVLFLRIYGSENKFNFNRWTKYIFLERVIYIVEKKRGHYEQKEKQSY
ncbi:hypothetical protein, partial [Anaerobutyricum hallii]|uniref:hypothetical protein n=1 Tax=Anaerobutyricum hallii TaxID=39488 RepID=UPI001A9A6360